MHPALLQRYIIIVFCVTSLRSLFKGGFFGSSDEGEEENQGCNGGEGGPGAQSGEEERAVEDV